MATKYRLGKKKNSGGGDGAATKRHDAPGNGPSGPGRGKTGGGEIGRGRIGRLLLALLRLALVALVWGIILLGGVLAFFAYDLPDLEQAISRPRKPGITLVAADGGPVAAFGDLYGRPLKLSALPPHLPQALIAIEDRRFYRHFGLDPIGLARAAWTNWRTGRVAQGGSTITQQVAKNLFLTPERTLKRKVQELLLALWMERKLAKAEILELYLNRVYLGAGAYGVDAAARRYFGIGAEKLSLLEAAVLAGLPKAPSKLSPARDPKAALERARRVLAAMKDQGVISADEETRALSQAPRLLAVREGGFARHFADWVLDQVDSFIGQLDRDLVVVTTLDRARQRKAEGELVKLLDGPGVKAKAGEGAVVVLALDGAVKAMAGGRDWRESAFNRATGALRQPGSAFKPFVWLTALESGLQPDTLIEDAPVKFGDWSPENYDGRYRGSVTLAEALAQSLNTVSARLAERVGAKRVAATAERLGIASRLRADLSLALGTSEVTPIELVSAFIPFANGGRGAWPYGIAEIRDAAGSVLYRRSGGGPGQLVQPEIASRMRAMLAGVVSHGTGKAARLPEGRFAAGKTGTTQDYRDAWFVGFTNELAAAVWLGNDEGQPMREVTGGGLPAELWRAVME
jgi:penicillin-binding protein 1A